MGPLSGVNVIIAGSSTDGIAAAIACKRYINNPDLIVKIKHVSQLHTFDPATLPTNSTLALLDIAVNNQNPKATQTFLNSIYGKGHTIAAIADEHGAAAWKGILEQAGHSLEELRIQPKDRGPEFGSTCDILAAAFGKTVDPTILAILRDGNQADQMNFKTPYGRIINKVLKSKLSDPKRVEDVIDYLAKNEIPEDRKYKVPNEKIQGYIQDYKQLKINNKNILATLQVVDGIAIYDAAGKGPHDATSIFETAYKTHSTAILKNTPIFSNGQISIGVSIATNDKGLNIVKILQEANIPVSGMAGKGNIQTEHVDAANKAVVAAIKKL